MVPGPAGDEIPEPCIALSQNYPNPFNPVTWIEFTIPRTGPVSLEIYDISAAAAGVYFYRLRAAGESLTRKMVLLR